MPPEIKKNILLVDDDPTILLTVGDRLKFEGYEVLKARECFLQVRMKRQLDY